MKDTEPLRHQVLQAGAMEIRDVNNGAEPFLYASGNWCPDTSQSKAIVGRKGLFKALTRRPHSKSQKRLFK